MFILYDMVECNIGSSKFRNNHAPYYVSIENFRLLIKNFHHFDMLDYRATINRRIIGI